jgi:hypothetical protein
VVNKNREQIVLRAVAHCVARCREPSSFAGFAAFVASLESSGMPFWARAVVFVCGIAAYLLPEGS